MKQPEIGDNYSEKELKAEGFEEFETGQYLRRIWVRGTDLCYLMCRVVTHTIVQIKEKVIDTNEQFNKDNYGE